MFLEKITHPDDLKKLSLDELDILASEIRQRILSVLSANGGHLASNLGMVELTIAMHYSFTSPDDAFIFDTSHQIYTHKILSGRNKDFDSLRRYKGISGFSHPSESEHDHFFSGHAGTALSLALGMSKARDYEGDDHHILPILGDASFNCGLILEAMNHIPKDLKRFVVILNDNNMAISSAVGNFRNILSRLINHPKANKAYKDIISWIGKIPSLGPALASQGQKIKDSIKNLINTSASFFEHFGLSYVGPIDGHDIRKLIDTFSKLKNLNAPTFVHILTTKGKGMEMAEAHPTPYHGVKPFDLSSGKFYPAKSETTFPKEFGKVIVEIAKEDENLHVLCPAMIEGSSLNDFQKLYPDRCKDVGIAESHCVTYAGGMALKGSFNVVVSIYSTFIQRAFDNVFHDVCMQNFPIIFAIDRSSLSGPDGVTHHGIYDLTFLFSMPNLVIAQPRDGQILADLFSSAFAWERPVAIRYPNKATTKASLPTKVRKLAKAEILSDGEDIALIAVGHMVETALEVKEILAREGISCCVIDPIFLKPFDEELFSHLLEKFPLIATIEEHALIGGFGSIFNSFAVKKSPLSVQIINYGIPDKFVYHGESDKLIKEMGLDSESIAQDLFLKSKKILSHMGAL